MKRYFYIVGDYGDGDLVRRIIELEDTEFEEFKPLIKDINNFQPYPTSFGWKYSNWRGGRSDLGDKSYKEIYSQFPEELLTKFEELVVGQLHVPEYCDGIHTIISFQEIKFIGEPLIEGEHREIERKRTKETIKKMEEYNKRIAELSSYTRPSDGKSLCSILFNQMTDKERKLIEEYENLWKEYM